MSKKFKSQASSARAASTAFGSPSFGFGSPAPFQTSSSSLSYVTEQPDLSGISEPNVVVAFKNLGKKDSTTKEKALDELNAYLSSGAKSDNFTVESPVIEAWINLYPRTSIDSSRRVRQIAHTLQGTLTSMSGKRIAPHLSKIVGSWLAGTYDQDRAVARAASDALQKSFNTPEKRKALWKLYSKDLLSYVEDATTVQTSQTLSDERTTSPDDAEGKYIRVVGSGLSLLNALLLEQVDNDKVEEEQTKLLSSSKLWEHAYSTDAFIRRGTYTLFTTCLARRPNAIDWKVISAAFLGKALHTNQLGSTGSFTEALLTITRHHPEAWTTDYKSKQPASKRFLKFLQQGSQRGPASFWSNIAHLTERLPRSVWNTSDDTSASDEAVLDAKTVKLILDAYQSGILSTEEPRQNLTAAWKSYMEVCVWLCEQIADEQSRTSVLNDHILPAVHQFVMQDSSLARWTISSPAAAVIIVQVLHEVGSKFGFSMIGTLWSEISEKLITEVKVSQPEQSSSFRASQDRIGACSRRFFGLEAGLLGGTPDQSSDNGVEDALGPPTLALIEQSTSILRNRNGKPYSAASLINDVVDATTVQKTPGFSGSVRNTVLDFLESTLESIAGSPSAGILISLLLKLKNEQKTSDRAEDMISKLLSSNVIDAGSPAFQALVLSMTEADLKKHPKIQQDLLDQIDQQLASETASWTSLDTLLQKLPAGSSIKEDILSKMLNGLSVESHPQNAIAGFQSLVKGSTKHSVEQLIGPTNTSALLSKLLVLEETPDDEVSQQAHLLADQIRGNLKNAGSATKSSIEIIRQQLCQTGEDALSIHTVIDLARETYKSSSKAEANAFQDVFPAYEEWEAAAGPLLNIPPSRSVAMTSNLEGAALLVDGGDRKNDIHHDVDGYSAIVRVALFVVNLIKSIDISSISPSRREPLSAFLPLVLQVVNEKLDITTANSAWTGESHELEDEMSQLISDSRQILADLIASETDSETLNAVPNVPTVESYWLRQLENVTDQSPRSYRTAVAFTEVMSICIDRASPTRYSKVLAEEFAGIRKSSHFFRSAALVVVGRTGLLPTKRLATEYIVELTDPRDQASASAMDNLVLLNLLLDGEEDILNGLPKQRLVNLVKAIVDNLDNGKFDTSELRSEALKVLIHVLPIVGDIYDEFWATLWALTKLSPWRWSDASVLPCLQSTLKICGLYKRLATDETNDDLVEVWQEQGGDTGLADQLVDILRQYSAASQKEAHSDESTSKSEALSSGTHRPRAIVMGLLGRSLSGLPVTKLDELEDLYPLLLSQEKEVQSIAFDVLDRHVIDTQEQKSVDAALSKQAVHLPDELLSLLLDPPSIDVINESTQTQDSLWTAPRGYLLVWKLVFDHFSKASHKLREMYAEDIKTSGHLDPLLMFVNDLLKISTGRPVDVSRMPVESFDFSQSRSEPQATEAQILAAHLYYLSLLYVPNLTRSWWFESKNRVKSPLESWTQKQITPKLCKSAMTAVREWHSSISSDADDDQHPLEIKISPNSTELTASIPIDPESAAVSLLITLPPAYPLQQALVTSRNRVAVSEKNWQSWLRTIKGIIMFSNGVGIIDGLLAFRRNVQGALKGQSECAICYSIIGTDMKTPDKKCGTCKNMFHGACLFRWFSSSNESRCPLCRNSFNYA